VNAERFTFEQLAANPKLWAELLRQAMAKTGRGLRKWSLRHTGKTMKGLTYPDRRADKLEANYPPKWLRRLQHQRIA
jgi:hypothetical protein